MGIPQASTSTPKQPPQFDGSNVNDQLASTLNKGGLLMRMAQSKGQGLAAQRGLGNSTIGIDAAQRAMVDGHGRRCSPTIGRFDPRDDEPTSPWRTAMTGNAPCWTNSKAGKATRTAWIASSN